jgi:hypothetical protein
MVNVRSGEHDVEEPAERHLGRQTHRNRNALPFCSVRSASPGVVSQIMKQDAFTPKIVEMAKTRVEVQVE